MSAEIQKIIKEIYYRIGRNRLALQGGTDGAGVLKDRIDTLTALLHFVETVAEQSLESDQTAYVDAAATNLASELVLELSEGWGEAEEAKAADQIRPLIRRCLAPFVLSGSFNPAAIDVVALSKDIISTLSEGWGEDEEAKAAGQIRPLLRQTITTLGGTATPADAEPLAARIVAELSEGWGSSEERKAARDITPVLQKALGCLSVVGQDCPQAELAS